MEQKTVFISYRRALSKHLARAIYMDLRAHGWDVFLDVNTIDSGDFDRIILNQIGARAHFILLISPGSLERCANSDDWVLREIQEAVRLERNIVPIIEEGADFNQEMSYLPSDLRAIISKKNALPLLHFYFDAAVEMLRTRFLKTPEYITITAPPPAESAEAARRMAAVEAEAPALPKPAPTRSTSLSLMPAPFDWIEIPKKGYSIAKYPITNAQFAKFIEAGGYKQQKWWTQAGWEAKAKGWAWNSSKSEWEETGTAWTQPRYWTDSKWNGAEQPIVGVSWYEAVAFCLWLSEATGEKIMLPTEDQWQYAAQGDDGRAYPWGNDWDCKRCNNSVEPCDSNVTTPVTQYEGNG
ncbi:MAG TPA: SUMF1/EgtB/PvdO family nonheme iron enzyme, partial [Spirillospora sp.]|nr:SUMF1/EgtB/PvdO family nonheme iron enzyme [Spirillospora sp.]